MSVFLSLFINLLPLYILIAAGYYAAKMLKIDKQSMATLAIYICMPIVVFGFLADLNFKSEYVVLPFFFLAISLILGIGAYAIGRRVYKDKQANLSAMCISMGNTGYFGLPLLLLFFDSDLIAVYIFMTLGGLVYEATFGYYLAVRSQFTMHDSLRKLLRFPTLYAMSAGFAVNASGMELPEQFWTYWAHFKGAYVILGMMIIGAALSELKSFTFGPRFVALVFTGKFLVFPALGLAFITLDKFVLNLFSVEIYHIIIISTVVPPAANIAAFAAQMNMEPEKAATTILLGTIFALFYIPCVIMAMGL